MLTVNPHVANYGQRDIGQGQRRVPPPRSVIDQPWLDIAVGKDGTAQASNGWVERLAIGQPPREAAAGVLTSIADALNFIHPLADPESKDSGLMFDPSCQCRGFNRPYPTAPVADEVDIRRGRHRVDIREKRVFALDPRYQTAFEQNSQRPVHTCWQHPSAGRHLKLRDDDVGAKRPAGADQDVQDHLVQGRQFGACGP
jgi:hypothetical protein